nr:MBL fold metallo-hydrolase [Candidatus Paceibacterota bacterium]
MRLNRKHFYISILSIILILSGFYARNTNGENSSYLKIVFLDVGQGDSIYIEAPNGRQVLVDGGPDARILPVLSDVMPVFYTYIDMLIATHSDADHLGGLNRVIEY